MAARFSSAWLDELRERADIVQVVSEHVQLRPNGRRYWGLCPFHNEKTASFSVDADRQMYYCFGCKAGGSVIQFVMEIERLEFVEAVRHLAERVHMTLPEITDDAQYQRDRSRKERLLALNREAAQWYHQQLWTPEGAELLAYLHGRGIDDTTVRQFGLGATSFGWDSLCKAMQDAGYTMQELTLAGLAVDKNERTYDMFRQRALFPIISAQGQVLGFGGRAMGDAQPKYLNTPDTPVFNKRLGLYAVHLLRKVRGLSRVILVEGYMDVVSLVQRDIQGVLATLGTALTVEQARQMKRYAPEVWVAYDGDAAGQQATLRALDLLEAEAIPARVLLYPGAKDPDEFVRARGAEAFLALRPQDAMVYRMNRLAEGYDMADQQGRTEYAKACATLLRKVREPVELENHLRHLSVATGFSREVLLQQVGQGAVLRTETTPARRAAGGVSVVTPDHLRAECSLLSLLSARRVSPEALEGADFANPLHRQLYEALIAGQSPSALLEEAEDEPQRREMAEIFGTELQCEDDQVLRIATDCMVRMRRHRIQQRIAVLNDELPALEGDQRREAVTQVYALMQELNRLKSGRKE